jgi:prevent-host-death family protein
VLRGRTFFGGKGKTPPLHSREVIMIVNVDVAQANLSQLIERAEAGEEIIIARDSKPAVQLVLVGMTKAKRVFGSMQGKISLTPEFFDPLPDDELDAWAQ